MTSIVISIKIRIYLIVWRVPPFPIQDDDDPDVDDDIKIISILIRAL